MVQLVWDTGGCGTATVASGTTVTVGEGANVSPEELVAMAAASCLMRTFLRLAAETGIEILSYASTAHVESSEATGPRVHVRSYVVAPREFSHDAVRDLCDQSVRASPIARLLGDHVTVQADVRTLTSAHSGP